MNVNARFDLLSLENHSEKAMHKLGSPIQMQDSISAISVMNIENLNMTKMQNHMNNTGVI